ncbi:PEP-utilizing enzyme [Brevibacillus sp. B_LB10_24]|uniref:PEP-utilizing enzyme n=1 Tax=Brevibacillus sp. B_LB10_24 TaxID=3380645 RepID=UPI0038BC24F2
MISRTGFQQEIFLSEEDKRQGFWVQDDVHLGHAVSPLFASFQIPAMTEGTKLAFENLKSPVSQFHVKLSDGRIYQHTIPYAGKMEQRLQEHQARVGPLFPILKKRLFDTVEAVFLPFYRRMDFYRSQPLTLDEALQIVTELYEFYIRAWQLHFELVMPRASLTMSLERAYTEATGDPDPTVVYGYLAGVMNKTLETDRELWNLARQVKHSSWLTELFAGTAAEEIEPRLSEHQDGRDLLLQVEAFLQEYGYRTANSHEFADETWIENPVHVLSVIARYVEKEYDFAGEFARIVSEREEKLTRLLAGLPEGEAKERFVQLHSWALDCAGLDEDHHFYIDAMLPAKSRLVLLRVGELLAESGAIGHKEDIFFLFADELLDVLEHPTSVRDLVERRRREHWENKQKQVPPYYGTPPAAAGDDPLLERIFGGKLPEVDEETRQFTGYAASQGVYTGVVKVVRDPAEFAKVQKGDVLVCKTTTPAWTVLFSVVGAVVTDAGGILSHGGTVAREYRLPAVVGTKIATSTLKDGDVVTVNGTDGVVSFGKK